MAESVGRAFVQGPPRRTSSRMASKDRSPATRRGRKRKEEETRNQTMFAATMDPTPVVTIGANFTGANFLDFGANPPDTDGAVGPSQFVELLNSAYRVYDKSGNVLQTSSLNQFWSSAGIMQASPFDPRVLSDPATQRWHAAAVDFARTLLPSLSNTSEPTRGLSTGP